MWATNYKGTGVISDVTVYDKPYCRVEAVSTDSHSEGFAFDASLVVPTSSETKPYTVSTLILLAY